MEDLVLSVLPITRQFFSSFNPPHPRANYSGKHTDRNTMFEGSFDERVIPFQLYNPILRYTRQQRLEEAAPVN